MSSAPPFNFSNSPMTTAQGFSFGSNTQPQSTFTMGGTSNTSTPFAFGSFSQPQSTPSLVSSTPLGANSSNPPLFTFGSASFSSPISSSQPTLQLNTSQTQPQSSIFSSQPALGTTVGGLGSTSTSLGFPSFGTTLGSTTITSTGLAAAPPPQLSTPVANITTGGGAASASLSTTTVTTASSAVSISSMNFRQLKELLNKWTCSLDEEEKHFIEQATRGNYWDRTLMTNGDKITKINDAIQKVKNDHANMENSMDMVKANQRDLDNILNMLEESLPVNIIVEPEREHLYNMSVEINMQLQQMSEDLKEIIRHLNDSNKGLDRNDPVAHILRIMNEHTDTLQWMEDSTNEVKVSLEDVSKMNQAFRRDHERSMRIMFKY